MSQNKDQWIEERREKFRCPHGGDVIACSKEGVLGTARGFDQAKTKASSIRKQRGLKFDDVSFMTSRRFYGKTSTAPLGDRRVEYAPRCSPSKRGRFRGVWDAQGNYADLD